MFVTLGEAADNNEETADEMLGSRVADGPATETWLSSEERTGCNEPGSCDVCDAIADRAEPSPTIDEAGVRVLLTAPARDETAADMLGATVPEGPAADTWESSVDRTGWAETGRSDA